MLLSYTSKFMCHTAHLSGACEHDIEQCGSIIRECNSKNGKDYAECECDATPQLIKW
jgi:hypothetical protein